MSGWSSQVVIASQVIVEGTNDGVFLYNGPPGPGTLFATLTAQAGVDPYGNAYFAGFNVGNQQGAHFGVDRFGNLYIVNSADQNVIEIQPSRQAIMLYPGNPVLGNLATSVAAAAGSDAVGNHMVQGFGSYDHVNNLFMQAVAGQILLGVLVGGVPDTANAASMTAFHLAVGALFIKSGLNPNAPATNDQAQILLNSGNTASGTGSGSNPTVQIGDTAGSSAVDLWVSGNVIKSQLNGVPFGKQTVANGGITLGVGWASNNTAGAGQDIEMYLDNQDQVVITGSVHTTSATPAATIFTVVAPYKPLVFQRSPGIITRTGGVNSPNLVQISNATGNVSFINNLAAANIDCYFQVAVPLGNVP